MNKTVGILALQGAYQKHIDSLSRIGFKSQLVRKPSDLDSCAALILPGGESTTISLLLQEYTLYKPIIDFAQHNPVMGICAGMVLMADEVEDKRVKPLGLMPFKATRNYYGRQAHSFSAEIRLGFDPDLFNALFIRAPVIEKPAPGIKVLATYGENAVMIAMDNHIALSFHPELTNDPRIHKYWLRNLI